MLGKTAGGVYWLYRYLERVENAARLVEAGQRIALTRARASDDDWDSVLRRQVSTTGITPSIPS